ncbi:MAG: trigger factor [Gammaproteobacteria bacterium]|nr:trigger factor [Gammaproteobacteria bacterium]
MAVLVEKVSNILRRLTISVPADDIEKAYGVEINRLAKNKSIKGFRPGKAPLSHIEQLFGDSAREEATRNVLQRAFYEAIKELSLKPISTPQIEPKTILPNQPLEFIASFEVLPEIEKVEFTLPSIEKLIVEINENDINYVVQQLQKQRIQWHTIDRPAQEKDRIVLDYYAVFDGKADMENKVENFPLELGSKTMIPGFEEGMLQATVGEERTLHLNFPADYPSPERAGKPVDFIVQVKQLFEADVPEITEEFVKKLGVESGQLEDLKEQVRKSIEQERDRLVKEKLKEQIFQQLLEQNALEVPSALIANEAKNIHDEVYQHQQHDHHQHSEQETALFNDIAKKRVSIGLLIAEYAKQADIKVDNDRVLQRIQEIASVYEQPQEVIDWLSSKERRSGIEGQVLEEQVMDKLIVGIPVTEKVMSYAELKGIRE